MLNEDQLSDLFFNHRHPNWEGVFLPRADKKKTTPAPEALAEAIGRDAADFAEAFPEFGKPAAWYAGDFLARL